MSNVRFFIHLFIYDLVSIKTPLFSCLISISTQERFLKVIIASIDVTSAYLSCSFLPAAGPDEEAAPSPVISSQKEGHSVLFLAQ